MKSLFLTIAFITSLFSVVFGEIKIISRLDYPVKDFTPYYLVDDKIIGLTGGTGISNEDIYILTNNDNLSSVLKKDDEIVSEFSEKFSVIKIDSYRKLNEKCVLLKFNNPITVSEIKSDTAILPVTFNPSYVKSLTSHVSQDSLYREIGVLSGKYPLPQGTYSLSRCIMTEWIDTAASYIFNRMSSYSLDEVYYQPFTVELGDTLYLKNIVGLRYGERRSDTCIVIGAHYDDYSDDWYCAPGADDNATGTAGVLETVRIMSELNFDYDIYFILFSGEELGLYGSSYFVNDYILPEGKFVKGMINYDMIGFNPYDFLFYYMQGMESSNPLKEFFIANDAQVALLHNYLVGSAPGSDHYPFELAGFQACFTIEVYQNPFYHSVYDSLTPLNVNLTENLVKSGISTLYTLANFPERIADINLTDNGDSSVTVEWEMKSNYDIVGYNVHYKTIQDTSWRLYSTGITTKTTLEHLIPGEKYIVYATPVDNHDNEAFSSFIDTVIPSYVPECVSIKEILSDNENVYLTFTKNRALDFSHYRIYRKSTADSDFSYIGLCIDTQFTDYSLLRGDTNIYEYSVTAVDETGLESGLLNSRRTRLFTMAKNLLVIDETSNGLYSPDSLTDIFYSEIFSDYTSDIIDADTISELNCLVFANYSKVIVIDDDLYQNKINTYDFYKFMNLGGHMCYSAWNAGWKLFGCPDNDYMETDSSSQLFLTLGISSYRVNKTADLEFAKCFIDDETLSIYPDTAKLMRGSNGNLSYCGVYDLTQSSESAGLYRSNTLDGSFNNKPIASASHDFSKIVLNFPVYYMKQNSVDSLFSLIMSEWNVLSGSSDISKKSKQNVTFSALCFGSVTVDFAFPPKECLNLVIYDKSGRKSFEKIYTGFSDTRLSEKLNLPSGIYFIVLSSESFRTVGKISIIR